MNNSNRYDLIYKLDGRPPISVALPLGLQHVLAMFVGNLAPIFILTGAMSTPDAPFPAELRIMMIQCAMFVSGLVTLVQLYPEARYYSDWCEAAYCYGNRFCICPHHAGAGCETDGRAGCPY